MPGVAIGAEIPAFAGMTDATMAGASEVRTFSQGVFSVTKQVTGLEFQGLDIPYIKGDGRSK